MDWSLNNLLSIGSAFLLSVLLLWGYFKTAHHLGVKDLANERSAHSGQITTGGGLIMSLVCTSFFILYSVHFWFLVGFIILTVVGFVDDKINLAKWFRFIVQVIGITCVFLAIDVQSQSALWLCLAALFGLWWLNMFNFMDGANGMAGLHIVISGIIYIAWFSFGFTQFDTQAVWMSVVMIAVTCAYLLFNYPKAYLFMGDSGSLSFALLLFFLSVFGIIFDFFSIMQVVLLHSVFIVDASLTLAIRVARREPFLEAHNQHMYQRLIQFGWPHWKVSLCYASSTLLVGLFSFAINQWPAYWQLLVCVFIYLTLSIIYANVHKRTR